MNLVANVLIVGQCWRFYHAREINNLLRWPIVNTDLKKKKRKEKQTGKPTENKMSQTNNNDKLSSQSLSPYHAPLSLIDAQVEGGPSVGQPQRQVQVLQRGRSGIQRMQEAHKPGCVCELTLNLHWWHVAKSATGSTLDRQLKQSTEKIG